MEPSIPQEILKPISEATLMRLPAYYHYLVTAMDSGEETISCSSIAQRFGFTSIQIRKDFESIGAAGRPKVGYMIKDLIDVISKTLGYDNTREAFLVGAGNLGRALLGYNGFEVYGLKIIAAFDNDVKVQGSSVSGKSIFPLERFKELTSRMHIQIGIITVPYDKTQEIANMMVSAGIKAIWNFAPVHIEVPDGIIVENVNMAASLAVLSNKLQNKERLL